MARRKKGLTPEDRELWERVKRTATPLPPSKLEKQGGTPASEAAKTQDVLTTPGARPIKTFRIGESASAPASPQPRHDPSDRIAQAPIRMKQTAHRRMIRGKMKPEARIDLHGMTLSEAHPALVGFRHRRPCPGIAPSSRDHRQGARRGPGGLRPHPDPPRCPETAGSRLADRAAAGTARPRNPRGAPTARRRRGVLRLSQAAAIGSAVTGRNG
jgi:hypothetical protein